MISFLESFSTELLYEIFEYLSPYDLFRSFINLNDRFNTIIHSYPLHLNFQSISRLEFDYICYNLQPKQVISLKFSEETIPYQVTIFKQYFPFIKEQFIHLQSVTLIELSNDKIDLPKSVKYLEIRKYDIYNNCGFAFNKLLQQQAKVLTHLKTNKLSSINLINTQFSSLTHLIIDGDGDFNPDVEYENIDDAFSIFQHLGSSITHLHLFIDKKNKNMKINLEQFSHCLTHLTLHFVEDIIVSFQSFEQYLFNLHQLTHLTLQATGQNDLTDGNRWKNLILKINIIKFNFKFQFVNHNFNRDGSILLESFHSLYCLKQKHWYIGYHHDEKNIKTFLYTLPKFSLKNITYPSSNYPHITTPSSSFYQNKIDSLSIDIDNFIIPPIHRFTQVKSLIFCGSILMPVDILKTIMDFNQIEILDIHQINSLSTHELHQLIINLPRLNYLTMKYDPLFILPSHITTLRLKGHYLSISIDNLWHTIQNVKNLEIPINSKDMIINIIDQLDHLVNILFTFADFSKEYFIEKLSLHWLENHSYRLTMNHFTYRERYEYQCIQMAIGGPKTEKYSDLHTFTD